MKLRKITLLLLANIVSLGLLAEGYQLNLQSSKQLGMGHLGAALKLGGESMLFNPAGMAFMTNKSELSLGVNGVLSKVKYSAGTTTAYTQNPMGTPIYGYYSVKIAKNLVAGVSITNPAGNSLVWGDNWAGALLIQDIELKAFSVQPTIAWKVGEKLSIGAGLMVNFGDFSISKGLIPIGGLSQIAAAVSTLAPVINYYKSSVPVSLNLSGKTTTSYGFNVGILYEPIPQLSIGVSYRSNVDMSVEDGKATVKYVGPAMKNVIVTAAGITALPQATRDAFNGILALDNAGFKVSLPLPSDLKIGVAYKPTSSFTVSGEIDYVGWSKYDKLTFDFNTLPDSEMTKNWKNTLTYRVGAEYVATEKVTARFGIIYDKTPVDVAYYNPETPGANKFSITTGFTFTPCDMLDIDFGLQYLNGKKITGTSALGTATFVGTYKTLALIPSLGVKFKF